MTFNVCSVSRLILLLFLIKYFSHRFGLIPHCNKYFVNLKKKKSICTCWQSIRSQTITNSTHSCHDNSTHLDKNIVFRDIQRNWENQTEAKLNVYELGRENHGIVSVFSLLFVFVCLFCFLRFVLFICQSCFCFCFILLVCLFVFFFFILS